MCENKSESEKKRNEKQSSAMDVVPVTQFVTKSAEKNKVSDKTLKIIKSN
ncbi:hypothetical protein [uncultured Methanobrevibacter sp.]|nr:hypothetical protein [uncultured Methanobrevibacter sp.]